MNKGDGRRDLRERTKSFALDIIRLYGGLPKRIEAQVMGKQLLRSGTSVGANFHEAHRSRSDAEFVSKVGICLQELEEARYWIDLLEMSQIVSKKQLGNIRDESSQLIVIFKTMSKRVKRRL